MDCKGGMAGLGEPTVPIKDVGPPIKDCCCIPIVSDSCGTVTKFGIEVFIGSSTLPSPPNKSIFKGFRSMLLLPPPKRSKFPDDSSLGEGGAGIPFPPPNRFWSFFVALLSQEAPPNAVVKSAKSLSPVLELFIEVAKPRLPLDEELLAAALLKS